MSVLTPDGRDGGFDFLVKFNVHFFEAVVPC